MTDTRAIPGSPDIQIWVVHHNCKNHCRHCFLGPAPRQSILPDTAATCAVSTALGFDTHVYTSNLANEEFPELCKMGDCLVPNLQVETGNVEDNLHPRTGPVGVSLLSRDPEVHDAITRKGNHAKALAVMEQLRQRGIAYSVWTVVYAESHTDLPAFYEFVLSMGASEVYVNKLVMLGNSAALPHDTFLDTAEIERALRDTVAVMADFRRRGLTITMQAAWGPLLTPFEKLMYENGASLAQKSYCPGAHSSFGVDPVKRGVWPCYFTLTVDPLRIGTLDPERGLVLDQDWPYHPERIGEPCRSCSLMPACGGGCRGMSMVEHLLRDGALDHYAGFRNCPVNLGIFLPSEWRTEAASLRSFEVQRGMVPYH
ncbi:MAG: hypothetical protein AB1726_15865 [Planctomycetota bacterium]